MYVFLGVFFFSVLLLLLLEGARVRGGILVFIFASYRFLFHCTFYGFSFVLIGFHANASYITSFSFILLLN